MSTPAANATAEQSGEPAEIPGFRFIQRIHQYRETHPEATEYAVTTEAEARSALLAIADQVSVQADMVRRGSRKHVTLLGFETEFRGAAERAEALELIRKRAATDETALVVWGLKLVASAIATQ